ncbi:MAG: hypothetical protein KAI33_02345, partial [Elusimicrobiales bacterium]|nr:hypothetical protein [Elusimicrobiales bacterium]
MTPPTATTIKYDTTQPLSGVGTPVDGDFLNNLVSITGTAQDPNSNSSGIGGTQISISSGATFWSGATWVGLETWLDAASGDNWTKNTQLPPSDNASGLTDGALYTIKTRAYDIAGNTETVTGGSSFRFDVSSPTAYIEQPLNDSRYNALDDINGTARDSFNVDYPQVRIFDSLFNKYWMDGAGTCGGVSLPNWVDASCAGFPEIWNVAATSSSVGGEFTWHYVSSHIGWPNRDGELVLDAKVADEAGNYIIVVSTFSFDKVLPESEITYPPTNDVTYSSMTEISGTSYDQTSAVNDVSIKMWYLSGPTSYYWSPAAPHWTDADTGWWSITGAAGPKETINPWSYNNSDFTNPGTVNFVWKEGTHDGANGKKFYMVNKA